MENRLLIAILILLPALCSAQLSQLKGIGKKTERLLNAVGIETCEQLRDADASAVSRKLRQLGQRKSVRQVKAWQRLATCDALDGAMEAEQYECRTLQWYRSLPIEELGRRVKFFGARVIDNDTKAMLQEYKYPRHLRKKDDYNQVLEIYKKSLRSYAKECPQEPTIESTYTDPYYGLLSDEQVAYDYRPVEQVGDYQVVTYQTVDTIDAVAVPVLHMTALRDDAHHYERSAPRLYIDDESDQIATWIDDIKKYIAAEVAVDTVSVQQKIERKYKISRNRLKRDNAKKKDRCKQYAKGEIIKGKKRLVIELCSGDEDDISITGTRRIVRQGGRLVLLGDQVTVEVLRKVKMKVR